MAPTIAQSLGARGELREHLVGKQVLLLLDNLEQVLDCAPLIADLLAGLPDLSVIATSRERLAIAFEQEYSVPPLDEATAEELFVSRARQLEPGFEPDETVGEICRRLDRLPLALELASTRVKLMTTAQMLTRIERRLDLLSKGRRELRIGRRRCEPRSAGVMTCFRTRTGPVPAAGGVRRELRARGR